MSDHVTTDPHTRLIRVEVKALIVDPSSNVPIVLLRSEEESSRVLPIWIGLYEANAIALKLEGVETPRPMTHDLAVGLLETLDARMIKVVVNDLEDNTFYAQIVLELGGEERTLDSRPSDAIALALRTQAPIFVAESVLDRAMSADSTRRLEDDEKIKKFLEDLDPEDLGKYTM